MKTLKEAMPDLISEWSDKNGDLRPDQISYGSNRKVWGKGICGHEWEAIIKNRVNGAGCPYCSGNRLLKGFNDLRTRAPTAADEWSESNPKRADEVIAMSNKPALWKCSVCGGEWSARIADRARGSGCPYCSFAKIKSGINDYATWYPQLAMEWSEKNGSRRPESISAKARINVWWKCDRCGYEWFRSTNYRAKGSGCPECHRIMMRDEARRKRRLKESFPNEITRHALYFYAKTNRLPLRQMDDAAIGLPLTAWFPDNRSAIELVSSHNRKTGSSVADRIKDDLCRKAGIRMIRVLEESEPDYKDVICVRRMDGTNSGLSEALAAAFQMAGYEVDVDIERDMEGIQEMFFMDNE